MDAYPVDAFLSHLVQQILDVTTDAYPVDVFQSHFTQQILDVID